MFVSFEGPEGAGKSTQIEVIRRWLVSRGYDVIATREPGGTRIGLAIREVLLNPLHAGMHAITELLLYNAARRQHVTEIIGPALDAGKVVLTDRYSDSTIVYQGVARGLKMDVIDILDGISTGGLRPDITLLLDIDPVVGLSRNRIINKNDRFEMEDIGFHKRVREGFLELCRRHPDRFHVIDADRPLDLVSEEIKAVLEARLIGT